MSHQAVLRAIAMGRLGKSLVVVGGRPQIADAAAADREWAANTDLSRAPDQVKARAALAQSETKAGIPGTKTLNSGTTPQKGETNPSNVETLGDEVSTELATASAREKHFRAKLAELKFRERAGELVEAQAITAQLVDAITTSRTKLLGIPSKAKQRLPHLTLEDIALLEAIVREALEELVPPDPLATEGAAA